MYHLRRFFVAPWKWVSVSDRDWRDTRLPCQELSHGLLLWLVQKFSVIFPGDFRDLRHRLPRRVPFG
jgi:hypothetical protein